MTILTKYLIKCSGRQTAVHYPSKVTFAPSLWNQFFCNFVFNGIINGLYIYIFALFHVLVNL